MPSTSAKNSPLKEVSYRFVACIFTHVHSVTAGSAPPTESFPIREEYLVKKGNVVKNWKKRHCVLSGTLLYYYKKPKVRCFLFPFSASYCLYLFSPLFISVSFQDMYPKGVIHLKDAKFIDCCVDLVDGKQFVFQLETPGRTWFFGADSARQAYEWVMAIRCVLECVSSICLFYAVWLSALSCGYRYHSSCVHVSFSGLRCGSVPAEPKARRRPILTCVVLSFILLPLHAFIVLRLFFFVFGAPSVCINASLQLPEAVSKIGTNVTRAKRKVAKKTVDDSFVGAHGFLHVNLSVL